MIANSKASFICKEVFSYDNLIKFIVNILLTVALLIFMFFVNLQDKEAENFNNFCTIRYVISIWIVSIWIIFIIFILQSVYCGFKKYKTYIDDKNLEDIDKKLEDIEANKQKKKRFILEITYYDNITDTFHADYSLDTTYTYLTHFYRFYKWFFFRDSSEMYAFECSSCTKIFRKKDIKKITVTEKIV